MSKPLRTVGLIGLLVFDVALIVFLSIMKVWWWAVFFGGITFLVIMFEILSFLDKGKTISQQYWKFREEHPVASLVAMILFGAAMASLILHLLA